MRYIEMALHNVKHAISYWICSGCGSKNYMSNTKCAKCRKPRSSLDATI